MKRLDKIARSIIMRMELLVWSYTGTLGMVKKQIWIQSLVGYIVAGIFLYFGKEIMAGVVGSIATVLLLLAHFLPSAHRAVERFFGVLGHWMGAAISWVLLVPFFYITCTIMRIGHLLLRKDPMNRGFDPQVDSYWIDVEPAPMTEASYKRQY